MREKAVIALGEVAAARAMKPIIAMLVDKEYIVSRAAAQTLVALGDPGIEPLIATSSRTKTPPCARQRFKCWAKQAARRPSDGGPSLRWEIRVPPSAPSAAIEALKKLRWLARPSSRSCGRVER